jgi:hypothetical protein
MGKLVSIPTGFKLSSIWTPTALVGLTGWFDASDADTITESSGSVSQWDDKSDSAQHLIQASASEQPSTGVETIGGLNAISADGTEFIESGLGAMVGSDSSFTMLVVGDPDDIQDDLRDTLFGFQRSVSNYIQFRANSTITFDGEFNSPKLTSGVLSSPPHNGPSVYELVLDAGNLTAKGYIDGTEYLSTAYTGDLAVDARLVLFEDRSGFKLSGSIGEIIVTDDLSDGARQKAEGYLAWKWSGGLS